MSLKIGNKIRTILLLKISSELEINKLKKSKLKINSKSSFELGEKYSNTIINIDFPTELNQNQIDYHFSNNLNNFKNNICSSPNSKMSDITLDYLKKENKRIDSAFKHSKRKRFISKNYDDNNIIIIKDNCDKVINKNNKTFIFSLKNEKNKLELLSIKYLRKLAKFFKNVSLYEKIKKINELNKENINLNNENNSENKNEKFIDDNDKKNKNLKLYFINDSNANESIIHLKKMKHSKNTKEHKNLKSNDNLSLYKSLSHEPDILKKHRKRNSLFSKKDYNNLLTDNNISTENKHSLFLIEKTNHYFHEDNLDNIIHNEHNNIKKGKKQNNNSNRNKSMMKISKNLNIL
jgi:hypothetical protein